MPESAQPENRTGAEDNKEASRHSRDPSGSALENGEVGCPGVSGAAKESGGGAEEDEPERGTGREAPGPAAATNPGGGMAPLEKTPPPSGSSEASRWLAKVRAKIAQVGAARALAAQESFRREQQFIQAQQRAEKKAEMRRIHGPGHIPRGQRDGQRRDLKPGDGSPQREKQGGEGAATVADERGAGGVASEGLEAEESKEVVWRVPKPPPLKNPARNPAALMNDYALHARFQVIDDAGLLRRPPA